MINDQLRLLSQQIKITRRSIEHSKGLLKRARDSEYMNTIAIIETISLINSSIIAREAQIKTLENKITLLLN